MKVGDLYNWKNQPERLVYIGNAGMWYQFARVENLNKIWCELLEQDLHMLEQTLGK